MVSNGFFPDGYSGRFPWADRVDLREIAVLRLKMSVLCFCVVLTVLIAAPGISSTVAPWLGDHHTIVTDDWNQKNSVVVYNSVDHEYLVIWEEEISSVFRILGRRVDEFGNPVGGPFRISTSDTAKNQCKPDVAYDLFNNQYLVVWEFWYSSTDKDIYAQFIPGGQTPSSPVASCRGISMVVNWRWGSGLSDLALEATKVYFDGTLDPVGILGYPNVSSNIDVACSESGKEFFAVWGNRFELAGNVSWGIQGAVIDVNGEASPGFSIYWPDDGQWRLSPALAYGDTGIALRQLAGKQEHEGK